MKQLNNVKYALIATSLIPLLSGCAILFTPDWVNHAETAKKALENNDFEIAKQETNLVLDTADQYGGKMPPSAPLPIPAYFFPMQDIGEEYGYTGNLRQLASAYQSKAGRIKRKETDFLSLIANGVKIKKHKILGAVNQNIPGIPFSNDC